MGDKIPVFDEIQCPYCQETREAHDEDFYLQENRCYECNKNFIVDRTALIVLTCKRADCLNEGGHTWEDYIKTKQDKELYFLNRECLVCGKEEILTKPYRTRDSGYPNG